MNLHEMTRPGFILGAAGLTLALISVLVGFPLLGDALTVDPENGNMPEPEGFPHG